MSKLVMATADICPHGTSSSLCEWCGYKARIPHMETSLRDAVAEHERMNKQLGQCREDYSALNNRCIQLEIVVQRLRYVISKGMIAITDGSDKVAWGLLESALMQLEALEKK